MVRPKVIIADEDISYIAPLQLKFAKDFFDKIDLEVISERDYFEEYFSKPQKAEILIVSDELYDVSLQKHNIANVFVMMERLEEGGTGDLTVNKMFKYTSIKEIFNEIIAKSSGVLNIAVAEKKATQVILVTSAAGGVGKTTVAMGIAASLSQNYKKVLYLNASYLQSFQHMLDNSTPISSTEIYSRLANPMDSIYSEIKHVIRKESFSYLPPFKAALISLGLSYSLYEKIILSAKKSEEYDFIVVDTDTTFDEDKARLIDIADKVLLIMEQRMNAIEATNTFVANVNGTNTDKFIFICNQFDKNIVNTLLDPSVTLRFNVNEYIECFSVYEMESIASLAKNPVIQKISFLII